MPSIASRPKFISTSPRQIALGFIVLSVVATLFLVPKIDWEAGEESLLSTVFGSGDEGASEATSDSEPRASMGAKRAGPLDGVLALIGSSSSRHQQQRVSESSIQVRRRETLRIASNLSDRAKGSRKALRQYAAELERVKAGKDPSNLPGLAKIVSAQLSSDKAPQPLRVRWAKVSGIKDSGITALYDGKAKSAGTFAPVFRISKFWARQGYQHHGVWDPTARVTVKIKGYIAAENLDKGLVFINGTFNRPLDIRKAADGSGRRKFVFKQSEDLRNSIFTFRLVSKDGQFYDRSYNFYPRLTRFEWNGHSSGTFNVPWLINDPRIDRYFFVGDGGRVRKATTKGGGSRFANSARFESW